MSWTSSKSIFHWNYLYGNHCQQQQQFRLISYSVSFVYNSAKIFGHHRIHFPHLFCWFFSMSYCPYPFHSMHFVFVCEFFNGFWMLFFSVTINKFGYEFRIKIDMERRLKKAFIFEINQRLTEREKNVWNKLHQIFGIHKLFIFLFLSQLFFFWINERTTWWVSNKRNYLNSMEQNESERFEKKKTRMNEKNK